MITLLLIVVAFSMAVYGFHKPTGFICMQMALALLTVYVVYILSLWIMKRDKLVVDNKYTLTGNIKTLIIAGVAESSALQNTVIGTINPVSLNYAFMPRSVNLYGGAQFAYQFWMLLSDTSDANIGMKDILVRGDVTMYNIWTTQKFPTGVDPNIVEDVVLGKYEGILIKCPRIRFDGKYDRMAVEFNTISDPNPMPFLTNPQPLLLTDNSEKRNNPIKLTSNKWALYTFVFQDNIRVNDFEDGLQISFYINDFMFKTSTTKSTVRQNNGALHLFPNGSINGCKIANLAYYNYAPSQQEITRTYMEGVTTTVYGKDAASKSNVMAGPGYLSAYTRLDMYKT
jgi:hypothetical protein